MFSLLTLVFFCSDDGRGKQRDRYSGPLTEFKDKSNYTPGFKLDYVDEKGKLMNQKEAFRYLSHKFHGKGSGKNKIDKRMKKLEQESVSNIWFCSKSFSLFDLCFRNFDKWVPSILRWIHCACYRTNKRFNKLLTSCLQARMRRWTKRLQVCQSRRPNESVLFIDILPLLWLYMNWE